MGAIVWSKETLGAGEQAVVVPTQALACAKSFGNFWFVLYTSGDYLEKTGEKHGTIFVGQGECLFGRQRIAFCRRVVGDEAAGALGCEPFANVTLMGFCFGGNFFRG